MGESNRLRSRGFAAMFATQFLGAFNDNLFKNALVILIAYRAMGLGGLDSSGLAVLCGGVFILPFFLFSATAGQLADRLAKHRLVRWTKAAEIVVMGVAAVGLLTGNLPILLVALFGTGLQSAVFGPVKYGILPELVGDEQLTGANALVETGTFLAILLGTIAGGSLAAREDAGTGIAAVAVVAVALAGYRTSRLVPSLPPANPALTIDRNPVTPMLETFRLTRQVRSVFLSILGMSWFWFFGASILALLPLYARDTLGVSEVVVTFFLSLFCIGTALGSLLCKRLSGNRSELGLVPLGSLGMSLFAADLFTAGVPVTTGSGFAGLGAFLASPFGWRISADLLLLAMFGGLFIVPLYALIQHRSDSSCRSRVIAGGNILSAGFMVVSSLTLAGLLAVGASIPEIFLVVAAMNVAVSLYIYRLLPEFTLRFVAWVLTNLIYRLRAVDTDHLPDEGAAVLVCNHVTFIDWLVISSASKRPIRFVMHRDFLNLALCRPLFRDARVIPIASAREDRGVLDAAYESIAEALGDGELVCIFPEGRLTTDGRLSVFRPGVEKIVARTPVPVVPMALRGMWGSFFSRMGGAPMQRPFRRVWSKISLVVGEPIDARDVSAADLGRRVATLGEFEPPAEPNAAGNSPLSPRTRDGAVA